MGTVHFYTNQDEKMSNDDILEKTKEGKYHLYKVVLPVVDLYYPPNLTKVEIREMTERPEISKYVTREKIKHKGKRMVFLHYDGIVPMLEALYVEPGRYSKEEIKKKLDEKSRHEFGETKSLSFL